MNHIRPNKILNLLEGDRVAKLYLPTNKGPNALESMLLSALVKFLNPNKILEIGTYLGRQTLNFAMNTNDDAEVYTLDLNAELHDDAKLVEVDRNISKIHLENKNKLAFHNRPESSKVIQLTGDSTKFDYSDFFSSFNFIYIDGGHDTYTVNIDTKNAFKLVDENNPFIIAWHDYGNKDYEIAAYLDELSRSRELYHVEESMLCFYFSDHFESIKDRLV